VYIDGVLGHVRSAVVVIAYLLSHGVVGTVEGGVLLLPSMRRRIRLNPSQRRQLRPFEHEAKETPHHLRQTK